MVIKSCIRQVEDDRKTRIRFGHVIRGRTLNTFKKVFKSLPQLHILTINYILIYGKRNAKAIVPTHK